MRVPVDLHTDDLGARLLLIADLRAGRETLGISTRELDARFGVSMGTNRALEKRTSWEARTIMRYARVQGRRLTFTVNGIPEPDQDIVSVVLAAGDTSTPLREDRVHWRVVCHQLHLARLARCTAVGMAARLGVTENSVHYWERHPDGSSMVIAQRWARALGGWLGWNLTIPESF